MAIREAKRLLKGAAAGALVLGLFEKAKGEVKIVSEEEFKRLTGASGPAATAHQAPDGRPEVIVSEGFVEMGNPTVALVLAHEMTHAIHGAVDDAHNQQDPIEALIWSEATAAQLQARVALALGVKDAARGGMALGTDGKILSLAQTARLIRRDPFYASISGATPNREPPIRWGFEDVEPLALRTLLKG